MKIKPKKILVNLPIYLLFDQEDDISRFVADINTILVSKQKLKYEIPGCHAGQLIGLFYIDRTPEYQELRDFVLEYLADKDETLEEKAQRKLGEDLVELERPPYGDDY